MNYQFSIINFKITIIVLAFLLLSVFVFADQPAQQQDFIYSFHLYYDNGQLFADRDVQFKYDVIPEKFIPETINTQFPYKGEVINLKSEVANTFQFDPRQGNPKFLKGKISVKVPYVPDGQKVIFYNNQGDALLTIFVSESSFCNDDGVCNSATGEDTKTCPSDCKQVLPVPVASPGVLPAGGEGSGVLKGIIYLIIGIGIAGGFWWWRKRKSLQNQVELNQ